MTHLLPYLEQNSLHDQIAAGGGGMGSTSVLVTPASPDYTPGHWDYPPGGHWEVTPGGTTTDEGTEHQGHKFPQTKKEPDQRVWVGDPPVWVPGTGTPAVYQTVNKGIDNAAGQIFKGLQCASDPSTVQPGTTVKFRYSQPWSLTNYLANFRVMALNDNKAKPTRFSEVSDGLTHTVLFAEGMRLCDRTYRFALWNDYAFQHSHNFAVDWNGKPNTYMFQSVPNHSKCNNWRVQGLHYGNLNVAFADGSVRPLLKHISHLEISDPDSPGWGVDPEMGTGAIGVWDQLLLPNDGETVGPL
jgi:prepilin-type processing-associated H-X9-DG protein